MLFLSILWVLILLGVLFWAIPDKDYPRGLEQRVSYHGVWLLMVGLLVYLHYHVMAGSGHGALAVQLDVGALLLYGVLRFLREWISRPAALVELQNDSQNSHRRTRNE